MSDAPATRIEPLPAKTDGPALWDLVIADVEHMLYGADVVADMRARDAFGLAKYGTRLQARNGRNALTDAYQESLDLCVYLKQALVERYDGRIWASYREVLCLVIELRRFATERLEKEILCR